jgi:V8-like Glu-specific endopeptidase
MTIRGYVAALFLLGLAWGSMASAAEPMRYAKVLPIEGATTPDFATRPGKRWQIWRSDGNLGAVDPGNRMPVPVNSIRLHFADIEDRSATDYQVVAKGPRGVLATWSRHEFAVRREFWSPELAGAEIAVEVVAKQPPAGLRFRIDARTVSTIALMRYESIRGHNDMERLHARLGEPEVAAVAGAVAMLRIVQDGFAVTCSGVLVDRDMLLTNQHCIRGSSDCASTTAWFGHHHLADGRMAPGAEQIACREIVSGPNGALDYTMVRLARPASGWPTATLADWPPCPLGTTGACAAVQDMFVIHHPAGAPKMITRVDCAFVGASELSAKAFGHTCDTDRGSSGAPVFAGGRVVGLHHAGHEARECDNCINEAVRAEVIRAAIEEFRSALPACPVSPGDPTHDFVCPGG